MKSWLTVVDGLAHYVNVTRDGRAHIWAPTRLTVATTVPLSLPSSTSTSSAPAPSSTHTLPTASHVNGRTLAVVHDDGSLFVYDLSSRTRHYVQVGGSRLSAVHVSASSSSSIRVFVSAVDGALYSLSRSSTTAGASPWGEPKRVASGLGVVTALESYKGTVYAAIKNGSRAVSIDVASGVVETKWPHSASPPLSSIVKVQNGDPTSNLICASVHRQLTFSRQVRDSALRLVGQSIPISVEVNLFNLSKSSASLFVLEESGHISVYAVNLKSKSLDSIRPSSQISLQGSGSVLAATFKSTDSIVVVSGSPLRPKFQTLKYLASDGSFLTSVTITTMADILDSKPAKGSVVPRVANRVSVLSQSQMPLAARAHVDEELVDRTLSFADRLQKRYPQQSQQPTVESLEKILNQALKTKDKDLLATVFQTTDVTIVSKTVQKLSPTYILPLLQVVVEKFQSSPATTSQLVLWINAVVSTHLSYIVTIPNLSVTLAPLYSLIQSRLAVYQDVLKLKGRLDLMVTQINQQRENTQLTLTSNTPLAVYRDGMEEDSFVSESQSSSEESEEDSGSESMSEDSEESGAEDSRASSSSEDNSDAMEL
eukprot:TRINITY_DN704_c1_g2_i1.p1 TRINITY_DN704_c1_g2~~TRINITY_DN704_c1_g2_i1.p1  ORF type:complete len:635 (+),score=145.25 TRINITY_DN704_c1_g2_i1:115-1905(+)